MEESEGGGRRTGAWMGGVPLGAFLPNPKATWRGIAESPVLTVVSILALAFAIGISTHQVTVGRSLVAPLPVPRGSSFMALEWTPQEGGVRLFAPLDSLPTWRARLRSFDGLAAYALRTVTLGDRGGSGRASASGAALTDDAMALLGVGPALGRMLLPGDGDAGAEPVVVLSHDLWRDRFGADSALVGRDISIDGRSVRVVGVMPSGYAFPRRASLWTPLGRGLADGTFKGAQGVIFGRLRDPASRPAAQAELRARVDPRGRVTPFTRAGSTFGDRLVLVLMRLGMAGIVLVVLGNVATLTLARYLRRVRRVAICQALGASRARVVAELLGESVLVSGFAAALALPAVAWGLDSWRTGQSAPYWARFELDGVAFLLHGAFAVFAALAMGLVPALKITRGDVHRTLREGSGVTRGMGFGSATAALLVVQCALSVGFLGGASGLLSALRSAEPQRPRVEGSDILVAHVVVPGNTAESGNAPESRGEESSRSSFRGVIRQALLQHPGVEAVGWGTAFPGQAVFRKARLATREGGEVPRASPVVEVNSGYFETLGMKLVQGRAFDAAASVTDLDAVILSRPLADEVFGAGHALGRELVIHDPGTPEEAETVRVVGIVVDDADEGATSIGGGYVYRPLSGDRGASIAIRSKGGSASSLKALYSVLDDPGIPGRVASATPLSSLLAERRQVLGVFSASASGLGVIAWGLTLMSLYAMMSFAVTSRTLEVGIRLCLGASRIRVLTEVMGRGMILTTMGAGAGVVIGLGVSRLTALLPYDHEPSGLLTLLLAAAAMIAVAAAAVIGPIRRLTKLQAMEVVRSG